MKKIKTPSGSHSEESGCCTPHKHGHGEEDWRELGALAVACGLFQAIAFVLVKTGYDGSFLVTGFYLLAIVCGGWDAARDSLSKVPRGEFDMHFLMLLVAIGACAIGALAEGALLLFLFSGAGALEAFAMNRTKREIDALLKAAPRTAAVLDANGVEHEIPVDDVAVGASVRIRPGDVFPLDGEVLSGESQADESTLTGEAIPVEKRPGDAVSGGTLNLNGALVVRVTRLAKESALRKIIRLINEARESKAATQSFTERLGSRYTFAVLGVTTIAFFGWWWFGEAPAFISEEPGVSSAFYRAMTLLVVSSPCALVLSVPTAILAAIARGARGGVLFKGGASLEKLAEVDCVCWDKTGTLTTGELSVAQVESFPPGNESTVLSRAVALEASANHPLARAIVAYGKERGVEVAQVAGFESMTGLGVRGFVDEVRVTLGRRDLLTAAGADTPGTLPESPAEFAEVWVFSSDVVGRILLRDKVREESAPLMAALAREGVRTVMLTGDHAAAAEDVGGRLGLDEVRGGLRPEGKVEAVRALRSAGRRVAMVGDGVNDSPALAAADVAIVMGTRGSDAALEQAEIVLMNDRIERFLDARFLALRTRRIIRQNLFVSVVTIVLMVAATLTGKLPLALGVFAHEGSTALVCLNSMRLLFVRYPRG